MLRGDIILHPVYRNDGFMMINKYTVLNSATIRHVKVHLKDSVEVIVANSREQF